MRVIDEIKDDGVSAIMSRGASPSESQPGR